MIVKKDFYEPEIEIVELDDMVCLYTSTTGNDGDIWEEFDSENWL